MNLRLRWRSAPHDTLPRYVRYTQYIHRISTVFDLISLNTAKIRWKYVWKWHNLSRYGRNTKKSYIHRICLNCLIFPRISAVIFPYLVNLSQIRWIYGGYTTYIWRISATYLWGADRHLSQNFHKISEEIRRKFESNFRFLWKFRDNLREIPQ